MRVHLVALVLVLFTFACGGASTPPTTPPSNAAPTESTSAPPAEKPGEPHVMNLAFPNGGSGYLALPPGKDSGTKHGAILVIQEWWGMNDWIKENARRFAKQGYVALAVDLYRGKVATDMQTAHELSRGLPEDRALEDMKAAFDLLVSRPDVDPARIGVIGWCMGGGYSLALAAAEPRLRASVINYGKIITSKERIDAIKAAVLGNFAGDDKGIPADSVKQFEGAMKAAGKDVDIQIFDGAGHAFMNPNNANGYKEDAAKRAWERIDAFFARTLK
jgi:carboxymethylenebutenolidase